MDGRTFTVCELCMCAEATCTTIFVCCRDGSKRQHEERSRASKTRARTMSRKLNSYCVARMIATQYLRSGEVEVHYIAIHTNHSLDIQECKFLPLPLSVKRDIQEQFALGKPLERIMDGMH